MSDCSTCRFSVEKMDRSGYGRYTFLECHRRAPGTVANVQSGMEPNPRYPYDGDKYYSVTSTSTRTTFPYVNDDDWCGEFEVDEEQRFGREWAL